MKGKRVFVSGGAGVIGTEIIPRLVERGATVMVGDLKMRPAEFPLEVIYRQGDLNSMSERELREFNPNVFIHLAATFERSAESYAFWQENFLHNLQLSHYLMTIAKDLSTLERVIFASSYLIYDPVLYQFDSPQLQAVSLTEDLPVRPRNLTGMAKFSHEIELRFIDQFRNKEFSIACARIYRGYGRNSRDVISRWVRNLLAGDAITVYRAEGLFDYIYAADTAEGLIRLAELREVSGIINLGTGIARSVRDVINILRSHFPSMQVIESNVEMPFEASQADMSLFQEKVNWVPEYCLERAIPEIIAFERSRPKPVMPLNPLKVLVSSASHKIPLLGAMKKAALRVDSDAKVIAGDLSGEVLAAYLADEFWKMPFTNDEMLESIIEGCKARSITVVLPTRDGELEFWARHLNRMKSEGIHVIVSSAEAIKRCVDKLAFAEFGRVHGLPIIPAKIEIDSLTADSYVVKERFGAGSRSIGLDLKLDEARAHASSLKEPIFQPFIPGMEFSVDAWADRFCKVKGLILRRRDTVINGESQITTTFTDNYLESQARLLIETLKLSGPVVLQAIIDKEGGIHVVECNARFGGASTTGISAGLDSLFWSLIEAVGSDVSLYHFIRVAGQVRQVRSPSDTHIYDPNF
jgi:carbamoyl-phosphate synthase large subunit